MPNNRFLTYDYFKIPYKDEDEQVIREISIPFVPIRIAFGDRLSLSFRALVDSGATRTLLPGTIGVQAGIDIPTGKRVQVYGIGRKELTAYTHKIKIYLGLMCFETEADFSFEQDIPLLGRNGFFNLFQKVIFDENFHQVQLIFKSES